MTMFLLLMLLVCGQAYLSYKNGGFDEAFDSTKFNLIVLVVCSMLSVVLSIPDMLISFLSCTIITALMLLYFTERIRARIKRTIQRLKE